MFVGHPLAVHQWNATLPFLLGEKRDGEMIHQDDCEMKLVHRLPVAVLNVVNQVDAYIGIY